MLVETQRYLLNCRIIHTPQWVLTWLFCLHFLIRSYPVVLMSKLNITMSDGTQSVRSEGIYHGLPVLSTDDASTGLSAIVVGASGMSGQSMIDVLAKDTKRWKQVYALSRRSPQISKNVTNVTHVPTDFLKEPQEIAEILKKSSIKA